MHMYSNNCRNSYSLYYIQLRVDFNNVYTFNGQWIDALVTG